MVSLKGTEQLNPALSHKKKHSHSKVNDKKRAFHFDVFINFVLSSVEFSCALFFTMMSKSRKFRIRHFSFYIPQIVYSC